MVREAVELKSADEIARIREAALVVYEVLEALAAAAAPGVTTADLDALAERVTRARGATPAFKGYGGFPAALCISVNDEVVHGIPSPGRVLRDGDVVSLDYGAVLGGFYGDSARTVAVGRASPEAERLLAATAEALRRGIAAAVPGARLGDVGFAIQSYVEPMGYGVVRDLVGHGIGRALHEPPQVPNLGPPGTGLRLRPGMVIAIEPMVNAGSAAVRTLDDGWTVVTSDGSLSAHFEHTVAVTAAGPEILSLPPSREGATTASRS